MSKKHTNNTALARWACSYVFAIGLLATLFGHTVVGAVLQSAGFLGVLYLVLELDRQ